MSLLVKVLNDKYKWRDPYNGCQLLVLVNKNEVMTMENRLNSIALEYKDRFTIYLIDTFNNPSVARGLTGIISSSLSGTPPNAVFRSSTYESGLSEAFSSCYPQDTIMSWQNLEAYIKRMMR